MSDAREVPILFSGPIVRAILDGRKTETRRIFKITDPMGKKVGITSPEEEIVQFDDGSFHYLSTGGMSGPWPQRWKVGDRLWVREAHYLTDDGHHERAVYAADDDAVKEHFANLDRLGASFPADVLARHKRLRPSIHMPRWASRITLEVTAVRVERLQEIDEAGAIAEGMYWSETFEGYTSGAGEDESCDFHRTDPTKCFLKLWVTINGAGSWDANPFVSATTFRRIANTPAIGGADG